jgi:hypothetical protein
MPMTRLVEPLDESIVLIWPCPDHVWSPQVSGIAEKGQRTLAARGMKIESAAMFAPNVASRRIVVVVEPGG